MQRFVRILTTAGIAEHYHYRSDKPLAPGMLVRVPFGRGHCDGVVLGMDSQVGFDEKKLRNIEGAYEELEPLSPSMIKFVRWVADYTMSLHPQVLKMALSAPLTTKTHKQVTPADLKHRTVELNPEQRAAVRLIREQDKFAPVLLNGVTGSGKTEVYFEAIAERLKDGGQVLILMPEIALTANFVKRFAERFGTKPLEWHSDLGLKEKREVWHAVHDGTAQAVIGARSALFLPFKNLQMIVVDEEHDGSYKQEDNVVYHARDMAVVRAQMEDIPVVLASATPSLETMINAQAGRYLEAKLTRRYNDAELPSVELLDLRADKPQKIGRSPGYLAPRLINEIRANLEKGEQSLLFLNRKGYAPLVLCAACGYRYQCPNCSAWLVEHRRDGRFSCHQCGYTIKADTSCIKCGSEHSLIACGPGIERIEAEAQHYFPQAKIKVLSADNLSRRNAVAEMQDIAESHTDIIIGTQIIAKGYHFPNLTLVGIVDGDMGLEGGDLRALEKTYQLLGQVAGRAGRAKKAGRVLLQTYNPEHLLLQSLAKGDAEKFYELEASSRRQYKMPPFAQLAGIVVSAVKAEAAEKVAKEIVRKLSLNKEIGVLGPTPAAIFKINRRHRYRILIKAPKSLKLANVLGDSLAAIKAPSSVRIKTDINPYSFL